jgi:hypothetical protein
VASNTAQVLLGVGRFLAGAGSANAAIVLSYMTIVCNQSHKHTERECVCIIEIQWNQHTTTTGGRYLLLMSDWMQ